MTGMGRVPAGTSAEVTEQALVRTKVAAVVKAVRLRHAVSFVLLLVVVYWMGIHPWMANWGSTAAERQMALPGDDLHPDRTGRSTLAITIDAPRAAAHWAVRPYEVQTSKIRDIVTCPLSVYQEERT
jgi:hypothetical protein